jgi:4-hydroxybenzoate polyprenyltransferase
VLLALIKSLRPSQWFKNVFVAVPLVFSLELTHVPSVLRTLAAIALFSLISGCVYVLNDLVDVEEDRLHPKKRFRPIAAGLLPIGVARGFIFVAVPSCLLAGLSLSWPYTATLATYFVLNLGYSFKLKHVAFVDVGLISTFFILRVLAGAFAIDVPVSPWLLICTFLLATFLAVGKRAHELASCADATQQRSVLATYSQPALRWLLHILAVVTVVVYALYTRSPHTIETFGTGALVYTVPFPIVGILRFIHLVTTRHEAESPTQEILKDPLFMLNLAAYAATAAWILYLGE